MLTAELALIAYFVDGAPIWGPTYFMVSRASYAFAKSAGFVPANALMTIVAFGKTIGTTVAGAYVVLVVAVALDP